MRPLAWALLRIDQSLTGGHTPAPQAANPTVTWVPAISWNKARKRTTDPGRHRYIYTHVHTPWPATHWGSAVSPGEEGRQKWGLRSGRPGKLPEGQKEVDAADEAAGWEEARGQAWGHRRCTQTRVERNRTSGREAQVPASASQDVPAGVTLGRLRGAQWLWSTGPR